MRLSKEVLRFYIVTDRRWLNGHRLEDQVEAAVRNGATFVQLRAKDMDHEAFVDEAKRIKAITDRYGVPLIINDEVEVAVAADADGVHLGQGDMSIAQARTRLGNSKIVGASAQTVEQAVWAEEQGADYLGVGAMFLTATKMDAKCVGIHQLARISESVHIPVVAIGGINENNLHRLKDTGVAGVAVVSAVFAADNLPLAARRLKERMEQVI